MELISVVIPVYNVERYLSKCIESILNQTYTNIEVLLINNGSTDKSESICKKYQKKDKRIKFFNLNIAGLSQARNKGIDNAKGRYITFIDSDDYVNLNYIETLYNNLVNSNSDISVCNYIKVYDNSNIDISGKEENKLTVVSGDKKFEYLYNSKKTITTIACSKLYKIEIFSDIRYPDGKYHEDEYTMYKILNKIDRIVFCDCNYYYYYQRLNGITGKYEIKRIDGLYAMYEKMMFFKNKHLSRYYSYALYDYYYQLLYHSSKIKELPEKHSDILDEIDGCLKKYRFNVYLNLYINPLKKIKLFLIKIGIYKINY